MILASATMAMVHRKSMYPDTLLHMLGVWGTVVHHEYVGTLPVLVNEQGSWVMARNSQGTLRSLSKLGYFNFYRPKSSVCQLAVFVK